MMGSGLVAKLVCPACWPLYTAAFGAAGIRVVTPDGYRVPLVAAVLALALGTLAVRGRNRRDWRPLLVGIVGSVALVIGEFGIPSESLAIAGVVLVAGASLWAAWPGANNSEPACDACVAGAGASSQNGRS
jgi:mercuric ion transport protein